MRTANRIRIVSTLEGDDLEDLIHNNILALVIQNFYCANQCRQLSERILNCESLDEYTHELVEDGTIVQKYFGVDRLGYPFNLTYDADQNSGTVSRYYNEAKHGIQRFRDLCEPAVTPIDKLRLELDEHFQLGATVAAFQGRKMLAGIGRVSKAELSHLSAEQPHFDALPTRFAQLNEQLAANIYLKIPEVGGELELWDVPTLDPLFQAPTDWRAVLPPSIKYQPKPGDLVIFNSRRPHAICSFEGEDRVTAQMFIGYQKNKPLQMWN